MHAMPGTRIVSDRQGSHAITPGVLMLGLRAGHLLIHSLDLQGVTVGMSLWMVAT